LKTIAAFLNSEGGVLLIGIDDAGTAVGIAADGFKSEDKMNLHFVNMIKDRIGAEHTLSLTPRFEDYDGKRIFRVDCRPSNFPCYVRMDDDERFYVRTGAATTELKVSQCQRYITERFK